MKSGIRKIEVDREVAEYVTISDMDYRLRTSCGGPVLVPLKYTRRKDSDIPVRIGKHTIYVSEFQYNSGVRKIRKIFLSNGSCQF